MWNIAGKTNAIIVQHVAPTSAIKLAKFGTASTMRPVKVTMNKRTRFYKKKKHLGFYSENVRVFSPEKKTQLMWISVQ